VPEQARGMTTTELIRPRAAPGRAAVLAAILAVPYLLVRRRREQLARHAFSGDHAVRLSPIESPRVVA
jgi:hypothetical protein